MEFSTLFNSPLTPRNFFCRVSSILKSPNNSQIQPKARSFPYSKLPKPSRRRRSNTLREKLHLIPSQDQVRQIPQPLLPPQDCEQFDGHDPVSVDSSIAELVIEESKPFVINSFAGKHAPGLSRLGRVEFVLLLCSFVVVRIAVKLFARNGKVELAREEVEMLRRKKKSRIGKEEVVKGSVQVVGNVDEVHLVSTTRPKLNRDELMKYVKRADKLGESLVVSGSVRSLSAEDLDFVGKVEEIREMARDVDREEHIEVLADIEKNEVVRENCKDSVDNVQDGEASKIHSINGNTNSRNVDDYENKSLGFSKEVNESTTLIRADSSINEEVSKDETVSIDLVEKESTHISGGTSVKKIPRIIKSVKKAREYLIEKHGMLEKPSKDTTHADSGMGDKVVDEGEDSLGLDVENTYSRKVKDLNVDGSSTGNQSRMNTYNQQELESKRNSTSYSSPVVYNSEEQSNSPNKRHSDSRTQVRTDGDGLGICNVKSNKPEVMAETKMVDFPDLPLSAVNGSKTSSSNKHKINADAPVMNNTEASNVKGHKNWLEDNFQQLDPIIEKIAGGFQDNYNMAKDNVQESVVSADISELGLLGDDEEFEWMKDERLREIVFQVRDNELTGRDPFHLMDSADQQAFFKGLEVKAEKVNEKLLYLHEWVHSRIENIDYGADGVSLDDPVEKIFPRWKGPTFDKDMEFLHKSTEHQMANVAGNMGQSHDIKMSPQNVLQESEDKTPYESSSSANTLIECSDGSTRPAKSKGKEHWQHTKKWSRGFLEVYNAETDPEIKSIMKDMGKELDKWITDKEIQDVAALRSRIPKRKRRYIERKMEKLKREVQKYGAPAVVSKYKEYSEEKEEDYLWWLDLQFVLCIELYTVEDGVQKVGFYSLEMAADLELDPKQYHVIAFEDPGDSKSFCYIVQAQMDTEGRGRAFVVPQLPKDAFREAKANGFHVTVIKKGEIKFNIDQTLEEVEEKITEIGSKMYHDKIMQERGVDTRTLMKGLIRADKARKSAGK